MKTQITIQLTPQSTMEKRFEVIVNKNEGGIINSMKKAIMVSRLERRLKRGMTRFTYMKTNGEIRTAFGTTKKEIAERHISGKGTIQKRYDTITYFDIEKADWRCFKIENIVALG